MVNGQDIKEIIRQLELIPHPEGGYYRETYRSLVSAETDPERCASTCIYFLLTDGERTAWHRVRYDEIYHFYSGVALEVAMIDDHGTYTRQTLGNDIMNGQRPQLIIPGGVWQSARCNGDFSLIGCSVSPGFDFNDFEMADDLSMKSRFPLLSHLF